MVPGQPSRTALAAASHRAAHQILEGARIFGDPLAARVIGRDLDEVAREAAAEPKRRAMRIFVSARARIAEDALAAAVGRGVGQLVILGAGLDTFAYRHPYGARLRVFEVDHPATQAWKRGRLDEAGIAAPDSLTFAPVDFERDTAVAGLLRAGLDRTRPVFFTWLGVVPYLSPQAVDATLGQIASLPGGAEVVFDYGEDPVLRSDVARAAFEARAPGWRRSASPGSAISSPKSSPCGSVRSASRPWRTGMVPRSPAASSPTGLPRPAEAAAT